MKKPDEIKEGLRCCYEGIDCTKCPYVEMCFEDDEKPYGLVVFDALAYIQQLESKLHQAAEDIRTLGRMGGFVCLMCAHYNHGEGTKGECAKCLTGDGFRWRGMQDESVSR